MKLRPLRNRVLIRRAEQEEKTSDGLKSRSMAKTSSS